MSIGNVTVNLVGSLLNNINAVTEDTQNLLVQCSIKPGDVDTSRMTKEECEHVRGVFKEKSEQIAFIVKARASKRIRFLSHESWLKFEKYRSSNNGRTKVDGQLKWTILKK